MKLNNKGFVASAVLYSLFVIFLFLIVGLLAMLQNRKMILDKLKGDIKQELNGMNEYTVYPNGTAIYYNPVTGEICSDYEEDNSLNENKTGCLKWYTFNDNKNKATVNMILDHNTTYKAAYNSLGNNTEAKEVQDELDKLINESRWKITPRLISAQEIAKITDNTTFDSSDLINWFFLDNNEQTNPIHGKKSKFAWLYDYSKCSGCNITDNNTMGYWFGTPVSNDNSRVWLMFCDGRISDTSSTDANRFGVRPVITISKKELTKPFTVVYDYTGSSQSFVRPVPGNYKIELWGAQGGGETASMNNYPGSYGGFTSGIISIQLDNKMYIFVGERPINKNHDGGYNGGGNSYYAGAGGGGATDLRLVNGNWDSFQSLSSRIMVAGAGGGGYGLTSHASGGLNGYKHRDMVNDGLGGLQTQGGVGGNNLTPSTCWNGSIIRGTVGSGKFGMGGNVILDNASYTGGTGGGSGYYGGGAGIVSCERNTGGAGAGGSSFISGHNGCIAITNDSTEDNIIQRNDSKGNKCTDGTTDVTCSYHYSGLKFTDTVMIDGAGCKWTTEKTSDCSGMPTHDGKSTMTGNSGNGYAKITYIPE